MGLYDQASLPCADVVLATINREGLLEWGWDAVEEGLQVYYTRAAYLNWSTPVPGQYVYQGSLTIPGTVTALLDLSQVRIRPVLEIPSNDLQDLAGFQGWVTYRSGATTVTGAEFDFSSATLITLPLDNSGKPTLHTLSYADNYSPAAIRGRFDFIEFYPGEDFEVRYVLAVSCTQPNATPGSLYMPVYWWAGMDLALEALPEPPVEQSGYVVIVDGLTETLELYSSNCSCPGVYDGTFCEPAETIQYEWEPSSWCYGTLVTVSQTGVTGPYAPSYGVTDFGPWRKDDTYILIDPGTIEIDLGFSSAYSDISLYQVAGWVRAVGPDSTVTLASLNYRGSTSLATADSSGLAYGSFSLGIGTWTIEAQLDKLCRYDPISGLYLEWDGRWEISATPSTLAARCHSRYGLACTGTCPGEDIYPYYDDRCVLTGTLTDGRLPIAGAPVTLDWGGASYIDFTDANGEFQLPYTTSTVGTLQWGSPWHGVYTGTLEFGEACPEAIEVVARPYLEPSEVRWCSGYPGQEMSYQQASGYPPSPSSRIYYTAGGQNSTVAASQLVLATLHILPVSIPNDTTIDVWHRSQDMRWRLGQLYNGAAVSGVTISIGVTTLLYGRYGTGGDLAPFEVLFSYESDDWSELDYYDAPLKVWGESEDPADLSPVIPDPIPLIDVTEPGVYELSPGTYQSPNTTPYDFFWVQATVTEKREGYHYYLVASEGVPTQIPTVITSTVYGVDDWMTWTLPNGTSELFTRLPFWGVQLRDTLLEVTDYIPDEGGGTFEWVAHQELNPIRSIGRFFMVTVPPTGAPVESKAWLEACTTWWNCYKEIELHQQVGIDYFTWWSTVPLYKLEIEHYEEGILEPQVLVDGEWVDFSWIDPTVVFQRGTTTWDATPGSTPGGGYYAPTVYAIRIARNGQDIPHVRWWGACEGEGPGLAGSGEQVLPQPLPRPKERPGVGALAPGMASVIARVMQDHLVRSHGAVPHIGPQIMNPWSMQSALLYEVITHNLARGTSALPGSPEPTTGLRFPGIAGRRRDTDVLMGYPLEEATQGFSGRGGERGASGAAGRGRGSAAGQEPQLWLRSLSHSTSGAVGIVPDNRPPRELSAYYDTPPNGPSRRSVPQQIQANSPVARGRHNARRQEAAKRRLAEAEQKRRPIQVRVTREPKPHDRDRIEAAAAKALEQSDR